MADVAISDLAALTSLAVGDLLLVTDDSESGAEKSKKITMATLRDYLLITGYYHRPQFIYKDADEIYVNAGFYDVAGKFSAWASQLTLDIGTPSASTWYYVYLDYSAITSGTALTASEFIFSTTAPTWSNTYKGYYNGSDRCCFAVLTDASANILEFDHIGNKIVFADSISERTYGAVTANTWTDIDCATSIPGFSTSGLVTIYIQSRSTAAGSAYWRKNGQSGSTGHYIGTVDRINTADTRVAWTGPVITDSSQIFEVKVTNYAHGVSVDGHGWYLPAGM